MENNPELSVKCDLFSVEVQRVKRFKDFQKDY